MNTYATSINNHRQIVGYFDQGSTTLPHAFLRQPDGAVIDLGTFGGVEAVATAINNRGQIAGWFFGTDGRYHAFLTGREETHPEISAAWVPTPTPTLMLSITSETSLAVRESWTMPGSSSHTPSYTPEGKCVTLVLSEARSHTPMGSTT